MASVVSCAKEQVSDVQVGQEVEVTFAADLGGALGSRAIADGTTVDEVAWAIYEDGADTPLDSLQGTLVLVDKKATLNVRLVTGKTYDVAFFAYKAKAAAEDGVVDPKHYTVKWDEKTVTMDTANTVANDEERDCFWYVEHDLYIDGPINKTFTLTRPLAQLNLGVAAEDVVNAKNAGYSVSASEIVVDTYATFNLFDGKVSDPIQKAVKFVKSASPVAAATPEILKVKDDATDYNYLATTYILVNEKITSEVSVTLWDQDDKEFNTLNYSYVPLQRNYRTNILGNLLTNPAVFTIIVDERFNEPDDIVFHAFEYGGEVTLQGNMEVGHTLYVKKDAVLNLNGYTLKNNVNNKFTDLIIVNKGATLTINGEGTLEAVTGNDGYAVISEGTLVINGGTYKAGVDADGAANAVIYARGEGKVVVNGGTFPNENNSGFVLNKKDADRAKTTIEVRGGKFYNFDPANNAAEGAGTNFCANGFGTIEKDNWYEVVAVKDYELFADHIEVYTAAGLAKWAYILKNENKDFNLKLMADVTLPAKVIAEDAANQTYVFTNEDITVTDGVPSGSNWPVISDYETSQTDFFGGNVDGNGMTISGLRINHDLVASGFICWTKGATVDNLTFNDAVVYNKGGNLGETYTGIIIGRCWDGSHVNNCHIKNSSVLGKNEVGGVVGRVYRRTIKTNTPDGQPQNLMEKMAYVTYCTTDNKTVVKGEKNVGGIVGMNYGAVVGQCVNNADVFANNIAGGVAGYTRSYTAKSDGYIIACKSSADATITSNAYAGGIVGQVFQDTKHDNTRSWVVGCASESQIVAVNPATMIGYSSSATVTACWAVKNGANVIAAYGTPINEASFQYNAATDATQADIDAMNLAIEAFNNSPDNISIDGTVGAVMLKRWKLVNGVPVLQ